MEINQESLDYRIIDIYISEVIGLLQIHQSKETCNVESIIMGKALLSTFKIISEEYTSELGQNKIGKNNLKKIQLIYSKIMERIIELFLIQEMASQNEINGNMMNYLGNISNNGYSFQKIIANRKRRIHHHLKLLKSATKR